MILSFTAKSTSLCRPGATSALLFIGLSAGHSSAFLSTIHPYSPHCQINHIPNLIYLFFYFFIQFLQNALKSNVYFMCIACCLGDRALQLYSISFPLVVIPNHCEQMLRFIPISAAFLVTSNAIISPVIPFCCRILPL